MLPFQFGDFADTLRNYVQELKKLATDQRTQMAEINREIDEGAFKAAADPHVKSVAPEKQALPPTFDFAPLDNAVIALAKSAQDYDQSRAKGVTTNVKAVNALLVQSERGLLDSAGLPGRPWFQHSIYAPGFYTGYGVKTIPGVREAIEQKQWDIASEQILHVAGILNKEAQLIENAAIAAAK